jgi:hypothetical protein
MYRPFKLAGTPESSVFTGRPRCQSEPISGRLHRDIRDTESVEVLSITEIVSRCTGLWEVMLKVEVGRGKPKAEVTLVTCYTSTILVH